PGLKYLAFGVYQISVILDGPLDQTVLYLQYSSSEASPKAISERTSYLQVRLEFLRYPHVIPAFSTDVGSGLQCVLPHLHPAHGWVTWFRVYDYILDALFRLAFAMAPFLQLNLACNRNSPVRSTKSTPSPINGL